MIYLQNDVIGTARRNDLIVPFPPPPPARWEERLFADARFDWSLGEDLRFVFSDRFNLRAEDGVDIPSHENIRNDFREGYLAWDADSATFFDIGRINLKSGVALGFNPTDFFKTRAVVEPLSADPSVLREDRLGTLMLTRSAFLGARRRRRLPRRRSSRPESRSISTPTCPRFDPVFDRTNAADALLLAKGSVTLFDDFSAGILVFSDEWHIGRFGRT